MHDAPTPPHQVGQICCCCIVQVTSGHRWIVQASDLLYEAMPVQQINSGFLDAWTK